MRRPNPVIRRRSSQRLLTLAVIGFFLLCGAFLAACQTTNTTPGTPSVPVTSSIPTITQTTSALATSTAAAATPAPPVAPNPVAKPAPVPTHKAIAPTTKSVKSSSSGESSACGADYYRNSDGNCVHDPVQAPSAPSGATALCHDGTYSFSQHRSGTCSGHGGVAEWL